jgi:calcium/calmodulin-dependent protein kinase I
MHPSQEDGMRATVMTPYGPNQISHADQIHNYQGALYQQPYYNGVPLVVTPWYQQQQPYNPWANYAIPPGPASSVMLPPSPYPQLGKYDPISNAYDIGDVLGRGAFSEVRNCLSKRNGVTYAVKIMKKDYSDTRTMDIMVMELRVLNRIAQGPHCVHLIDTYESPNHYFLVMDKITGGELFQRIVELKKYSEQRASQLVRQLLMGIQHLWSVGIVHRDLKPENLLLSSKDENADLLITDFGLSYLLQHPNEVMRHPVGTPGYVAPELVYTMELLQGQAAGPPGAGGYTKSVDMWAAGVIIYIMLCGFPPFLGKDTTETFAAIKSLRFAFPSPWWDAVSNCAKDLICRCLDPDPNRRITPEQALQHPWIAKQTKLAEEHLGQNVEELKRFNAKLKLKGAMMAVRMAVKAGALMNSLGENPK